MRVAITGASGFIGQEVIRALKDREDVDITAISRQEREEDGGAGILWKATDYSVDSLKEILEGTEAVIHLAAVRGTAGRLADYSVNELITENLLIAAGESGVRKVIFASTIAVYSDIPAIPWKEDMMLTPKTLYGITKAACEHLCLYYSRKYAFDACIVRIAQVLGPGEKRRVMTNVFMEQAAGGQQLHVLGKSRAKRQYIYSRDLATILSELAVGDYGQVIVNAGMEQAHTNLEIAEMVNRAYGSDIPVDYDDSREETIEPSIMSTRHFHDLFDMELMTMEEALSDIAGHGGTV